MLLTTSIVSMLLSMQVGWVLKGMVYAIIGGVACQASAQGKAKIKGADVSPQASGRSCGSMLLYLIAARDTL